MPLRYHSGEEIQQGDRVKWHERAGEIELVADPDVRNPETDWYVQEYDRGVMIRELQPKEFGRLFLTKPEESECLTLVSRSDTSPLSKSS